MPRQRTRYNRNRYALPDDFPQRLLWFQQQSGLSWAEIARPLGIDHLPSHSQPNLARVAIRSYMKRHGVVTEGYQVNLSVGANTITLTVTLADGQATGTYTITVTREAS